MEIPILMGRSLGPEDVSGGEDVAIVSEEAVRSFWPGENPIGKQILRGSAKRAATVVGVARDTKVERLGEDPMPFIYFARDQYPTSNLRVVAKGRGGSKNIVATLQRVIREVNPNFAVLEVRPMEDHLSLLLFPARVAALLLGVFGGLALFLAAIGLYGAVNFSVSSQTREIGIRMSLGAKQKSVIGGLMKGAMGVVAVGGILGLAASYALARVIQSLLFGVGAGDPLTLISVPILLCGVAFVAALVPALRATRVNPTEALRTE
jgi:ABC-type antimicrobial peptide transport system permease subunit